ncbi:AtzE family amidohydrolase [Henriciella mobilis]|nr:AtzE family amidohydrolase [Henriciella mobilis]RIJ16896.1 AtzE family amidohydrolase [Henriciella mobilis]RIJ19324.1 AtzE family amidohydrolase [Henriciella mobilis]
MNPFASAQEISSAVRSGAVTASEIIKATLDRIESLNPKLVCFTRVLDEAAMQAATEIDRLIAEGKNPGPLAGVPFGVKDLFDVEGLTTTAGSAILQDAPPATSDAIVVDRLRKAGAIPVGTLNMDEFAYGFATVNQHTGTTHNPHDLARLAGGSSGGSAAAVAAGLVPVALGSDTNGSVRVPASLCGIFGLRPTHGVLPVEGTFAFVDRLDTVGPFSRSVADARLAFEVMSGASTDDPAPAQIRAGLLSGWFQKKGQAAAFDAARRVFDMLDGTEEVDLPLAEAGRSAAFLLTASEGGHRHLENLKKRLMDFDAATRDRLIAGALLSEKVIADAETMADRSINELIGLLDTFDVLIAPSTPSVAPEIAAGLIELDGEFVSARANLGLYTQPLSLAGVPILSVPVKRPGQLPIGVQLVAARGREALLFDVAERLSEAGVVSADPPAQFAEVA